MDQIITIEQKEAPSILKAVQIKRQLDDLLDKLTAGEQTQLELYRDAYREEYQQVKQLQLDYQRMIDACVKSNLLEEGRYILKNTATMPDRVIDIPHFQEKHPKLYAELAKVKISVTEAEKRLKDMGGDINHFLLPRILPEPKYELQVKKEGK